MNLLKSFFVLWLCMAILPPVFSQPSASDHSPSKEMPVNHKERMEQAAEMVASFVADYRNDRFASDEMKFGIQVPDLAEWTVHVTGKKLEDSWEVLVREGLPETPTFIYNIEYETLQGIYEGQINALTAQGKAFSGDYTPMSVKLMEGYQPKMEDYGKINMFSFHFFTKGFPETIPFKEGMTRRAHGSNFVVFYYQPGLRTGWFRVLPQERVREDPREQAMPFPMLIVAIKGTTKGIVDGQEVSLSEGNTIFIPPNVHHKWWNETDEATEAILIMFGEGA
ncbi:MAG: cupin domain-containing protein [Bacteroidota bacterium]